MEETKTTIDIANEHIGWIIRDVALELGYRKFFADHVCTWDEPKREGESVREFAKRVTMSLPDFCSFSAFYACFEDRFAVWYKTGDVDGIQKTESEE